jgi:hypothetical protein
MSAFPTIPAGMGWPFVDATTGEFESEAVKGWLSEGVAWPSPPTYAGERTLPWHQPLGLYNEGSADLLALRRLVAEARTGVDRMILCAGDSKTRGGGVEPLPTSLWSYPAQLQGLLGARPGMVYAATTDNRWGDVTGYVQRPETSRLYCSTTGAGSITFTSDPGETFVGFNLYLYSGSVDLTPTVTVDGDPVSVALVGIGFPWRKRTVTDLDDTEHEVTISVPIASALLGIEPIYANPGLRIANGGRGSSAPLDWLPINDASLWATQFAQDTSSQMNKPDGVILNLATNGSMSSLVTVASNIKNLGIPLLLVSPGGNPDDGTYNPKRSAVYDVADSLDLPLVDFAAVIGTYPRASAAGLMDIDVHENERGYAIEAATLARVLAH